MQTQKQKKKRSVTLMTRGFGGEKKPKKRKAQHIEGGAGAGEEEGREEEGEVRQLQGDPLKGKIREALPDEYLHRASRWYTSLSSKRPQVGSGSNRPRVATATDE